MNLIEDIKASVLNHFDFLKDLGFSEFKEEQLAYEIHFNSQRKNVELDICFELIHSTPIWITVNGIDATIIQTNNPSVQKIRDEKKELYDSNFKNYLKLNNSEYLNRNKERYISDGKKLNDDLIKEVSKILKNNKSILLGDLTELRKQQEQIITEIKKEKIKFQKENGIYNCEYNWNGLICEHEGTLEEIEKHLAERLEMNLTEIVIFDWNGNVVSQ